MRARCMTEALKNGKEAVDRHGAPLSGEQGEPDQGHRRPDSATRSCIGVTDIRDESDRDGMRIVIEMRRGEERSGRHQQPLQAHRDAVRTSASSCSPSLTTSRATSRSLRILQAVPRSIAARCCFVARAST
jgi:DNA gyrase/topoisomerase IV subunit A